MTTNEALLSGDNRDKDIARLLNKAHFTDRDAAYRSLHRMASKLDRNDYFVAVLPLLIAQFATAANPDRTLISFENLVDSVQDKIEFFKELAEEPRLLEILIIILSGSQFLAGILTRNPDYFEELKNRKSLSQPLTIEQFYTGALEASQSGERLAEKLDLLRSFQRKHILRIGASDLMGLLDLESVTLQLSNLADALVRVCLDIAIEEIGSQTEGFVVIAMGKLGGRELNYSSDIDLLFISKTDPVQHRKVGEKLVDCLSRTTGEGFLYRVDMRLRPWGRVGALVSSIKEHVGYLAKTARLWEKQALLKARVIAGDENLGVDFLSQAQSYIFDVSKHDVRTEVRDMKKNIEMNLNGAHEKRGEVKRGQGSIRDIEFITQYLQLIHGANRPEIRSRSTLNALARLRAAGILPAQQYRTLADGYVFLRIIEHYLQMMHYQQIHLIPSDEIEINYLAHRLSFTGKRAGARFITRYKQYSKSIRRVYEEHLEGKEDKSKSQNQESLKLSEAEKTSHISRMNASYLETFSAKEIEEHAALISELDESGLARVKPKSLGNKRWQVTIVGYDYLGELSVICGLLFLYGLDIQDAQIFTYESIPQTSERKSSVYRPARTRYRKTKLGGVNSLRKIVDVFQVVETSHFKSKRIWQEYQRELVGYLKRLRAKESNEVQGELAKRTADSIAKMPVKDSAGFQPIGIEIDNISSEHYTVLRIDALDSIGFLYELTNALTLSGVYLWRVVVSSIGNRVHDTIFVTDLHRVKILDPKKLKEIHTTTVLVKHFTRLLPESSNPESALLHFREFVTQLFRQKNWMTELVSIQKPEVLDALAKLLGASDFLWSDFLRLQHENLFPIFKDLDALIAPKSKNDLAAELDEMLEGAHNFNQVCEQLNDFKDREMFRIDMRHIQGHIKEFGLFSGELSDLAEVILEKTNDSCMRKLVEEFGEPLNSSGNTCPLTVFALGKFGGRELGFASDIELIFVYLEDGRTNSKRSISSGEFFEKLVQEIDHAIQAKRAGVFEIDLRLRPYGKAGKLAVPLQAFKTYFAPDGPAWSYERQGLIKLRPIIGDKALGEKVVEIRDQIVYSGDAFDVMAMRAMRERQIRQLVPGGTLNAKFSPGGLVDVEYLVQGLQINSGRQEPELRETNTRKAIAGLAKKKILTDSDFKALSSAHAFLRRLIDALRIVRGNAKDLTVPSTDSEEFAFLARRLESDPTRLANDITHHTTVIQEMSGRLLPVVGV